MCPDARETAARTQAENAWIALCNVIQQLLRRGRAAVAAHPATSLGAAGITPVSPQARSFSIFEAILGILYLAVLITGLIGTYRPRSTGR